MPPHPSRPVLLTAFDAFGAKAGSPAETNPSWRVAQAMTGETLAGHTVVTALLPTAFGRSLELLNAHIERLRPALVICLGVAESRRALSLERIAINIDDARIPDNAGRQPIDTPVVDGGAAGLFSTLPIKAMADAVNRLGVPVEISQTAGTFVCNHVFYGLMHRLAKQDMRGIRGGFIHLPLLGDTAAPGKDAATMVTFEHATQALRLCIEIALTRPTDSAIAGGAID